VASQVFQSVFSPFLLTLLPLSVDGTLSYDVQNLIFSPPFPIVYRSGWDNAARLSPPAILSKCRSPRCFLRTALSPSFLWERVIEVFSFLFFPFRSLFNQIAWFVFTSNRFLSPFFPFLALSPIARYQDCGFFLSTLFLLSSCYHNRARVCFLRCVVLFFAPPPVSFPSCCSEEGSPRWWLVRFVYPISRPER